MTNNALEMNYKCTKQNIMQTLNNMMEKNFRMYNYGDLVQCKVTEKLAKREVMEMSSKMQGDGHKLYNTRQWRKKKLDGNA